MLVGRGRSIRRRSLCLWPENDLETGLRGNPHRMTAVDACVVKNSDASTRRVLLKNNKRFRVSLVVCTVLAGLSGCATSNQTDDVFRIDRAQGSQENIASLTSVINANPQDPEGYNVRGSAYGRAGDLRRAIEDFNKALQLNPRFYQASCQPRARVSQFRPAAAGLAGLQRRFTDQCEL